MPMFFYSATLIFVLIFLFVASSVYLGNSMTQAAKVAVLQERIAELRRRIRLANILGVVGLLVVFSPFILHGLNELGLIPYNSGNLSQTDANRILYFGICTIVLAVIGALYWGWKISVLLDELGKLAKG